MGVLALETEEDFVLAPEQPQSIAPGNLVL
jgi:hypothetical protein